VGSSRKRRQDIVRPVGFPTRRELLNACGKKDKGSIHPVDGDGVKEGKIVENQIATEYGFQLRETQKVVREEKSEVKTFSFFGNLLIIDRDG